MEQRRMKIVCIPLLEKTLVLGFPVDAGTCIFVGILQSSQLYNYELSHVHIDDAYWTARSIMYAVMWIYT